MQISPRVGHIRKTTYGVILSAAAKESTPRLA
jgi:hypothetical protein